MTEEGVYKTIVQFPFLPVPLASGGGSWLPSFDAIRTQHCAVHEAGCPCCTEHVREGGKSLTVEADTQNKHRRRPIYPNAWRPFIPSIDITAPGHVEPKAGLPQRLDTVQRERRGGEEREGGEE